MPPILTNELARLLLAIEDPVVNTVPVSSGKVTVRSAVGSVTVKVVSKSFAVDHSKVIPLEPKSI